MNPTASRRHVVIEPLTRVEGHGKVTIEIDDDGRVRQSRLHIVEFRGFERFVQGRPYWEVPVLVQRLCGICPVSHHLAAAKAMDRIVGADALPPTAEKMRRLMHYGQILQSHALHFFHLASPDLLFGFEAPVDDRNVVAVARRFPDLALMGIQLRRFGQEIIEATAGKRIHGTGAIPGGVNQSLPVERRDHFRAQMAEVLRSSQRAVEVARDYTTAHVDELRHFADFPSSHLSLVREDGAMDLYDGRIRAVDADGRTLLDLLDVQAYREVMAEEVRDWSYMKFPFLRERGPEDGWYRVGPLARMNTCDCIPSPLAERARQDFRKTLGQGARRVSMAYHWARMIEMLHAAEVVAGLLEDDDLLGTELCARGERRTEAVGAIEAPRGTLIHHYEVGEDDLVRRANLIVSTTHNNEAMNRAVRRVAEDHLQGVEIREEMLNRIEVAIRAYDPCLSCATHAMGRMPLIVEVVDTSGRLRARRSRDGGTGGARSGD